MLLRRIALIVVFALLAVGVGGTAGATEMAGDRFAAPDPAVVIVQQNPGEIIGAVIGTIIAYAGIAVGESVMNAAIAFGPNALGLWQIGKNIWDAACDIGKQADLILGGQPTFIFICSLFPDWPH